MVTPRLSGTGNPQYQPNSQSRVARLSCSSPLLAVLSAVYIWQPLPAQLPIPPQCDENLLRLASPVNGYQRRGNRCEGLYARQVAGTTLFLSSFAVVRIRPAVRRLPSDSLDCPH